MDTDGFKLAFLFIFLFFQTLHSMEFLFSVQALAISIHEMDTQDGLRLYLLMYTFRSSVVVDIIELFRH